MFPPVAFGIRLKLTAAFVGIVAVTVVSAGYLTIHHSYEALRRQKQQDELVMARNIAAQVDEVLSKAQQTIEALSDHPAIRSMDSAKQRDALTLVTKVTELIDGLVVLDPKGDIITMDMAEPDTQRLLPEFPIKRFVESVRRAGRSQFSEIYRSQTGELAVTINSPIYRDNALAGVLLGGILLKNHSMGGIEGIRIGKSGYAYIVDSKGAIIVHPQRERLLEDFSTNPAVQELLRKREGSIEFVNTEGIQILAAFAPIKETGWGVVVRQATTESYAYAQQILKFLTLIFFLSLACAVVLGILLAWQVARPVTALVQGAKRVATGCLDTQISVTSRDELGMLAGSFNEMTLQLRKHMDQTEQAHLKVLDAQRQLAQSEKMAAIGQLAAGLAHEINNPLNVISGFADHLLEKTPGEDPRRPHLEDISREAVRCQKLVGDVLRFAKPKEPERSPSEINLLVEETLALVQSKVRSSGIEVESRLQPDLPLLELDRDQIKQVLLNVLLNACQSMTGGGRLSIQTRLADGRVAVMVHDTGVGIPREHLHDIFNPFFTTKEDGTGLGLSLSYAMVEQHGGTILVESRPGQGSTFTVSLPLADPDHGTTN